MNTSVPGMQPRFRTFSAAMLAALLFSGTPALGQTLDWVNQPLISALGGNDQGRAIAQDASGNVYVTGAFSGTADFDPGSGTANLNSAGSTDIFIAKYNASGNFVWAKRVGGTGGDIGYAIVVDGSGNVHVTGNFTGSNVDFDPGAGTANLSSAGSTDIFIAKYDASGNYLWAKQTGGALGDVGSNLALDGSGNVYATGVFAGSNVDFDPGAGTATLSSAGGTDIFIVKYDASGTYGWANRVGGSSNDAGFGLATDGSGNVHATGYFQGSNIDFDPGAGTATLSSAGSTDIFIAKYDASGGYLWAGRMGGSSGDVGNGIALDGSGNVHVTGYFLGSNIDFDPGAGTALLSSAGGIDIFIAKYDASGTYLWAQRVGGSNSDQSNALALDGSGNAYFTGIFTGTVDFDPGAGTANLSSNLGSADIFIAKYDASGNYVWAKQTGSPISDISYGLSLDASGNVCVTGLFSGFEMDFDPGAGTANLNSGFGNSDVFVQRLSSAATYVWAINLGGNGNQPTSMDCQAIARDGSGNVYATGSFAGSNVDFDPGAGTANLSSAAFSDIFIAKYDASGNYVWAKRVGGSGGDSGRGLVLDGSGNVYVTGTFSGTNIDFDPGAGTAPLSSAGNNDVFMAKYDASGNYQWANRVGGTAEDVGAGIALDAGGNVRIAGYFASTNADFDPGAGTATLSSAGSHDIFIAKYDASGNYLWANRVGGTSQDVARSIVLDGSGNVYATGYFSGSNVDFDPGVSTANLSSAGNLDMFIAKYDASGNYVWASQIGEINDDVGMGIVLDGSGNVCVTGYFWGSNVDFDPGAGSALLSNAGELDVFIAKYDASGTYLWAKSAGGSGNDVGWDLALDGSGNMYITGNFDSGDADFDPGAGTATLASSAGSDDIFIAKYDASGNYALAMKVGNTSFDYGRCIAAGSSGEVNVGGQFNGTVDFDPGAGTVNRTAASSFGDIFIAKYADPEIVISGTLIWEHDDLSGVGSATVALTGDQTASATTPAAGTYSFTVTSGSNFTVTPTKNINKLNGVTVADATAVQQHVGYLNAITDPFKLVCADVNMSNSITTTDASVINQSLLGNPAALVQFKTSWRFVPASYTMTNPPWGFPEVINLTGVTTNQTGKDFYGIKTGDVVATYANPANFSAGNSLVFNAQDQILQSGSKVVAEFSANQLDDLAAFQFALKFNIEKLELIAITPLEGLPLTLDNFGTYNLAEGEIRVAWSQATGVAVEEAAPVFSLTFKVLEGGGPLSEALYKDESELPAFAYNSVLEESKAELNYYGITGTNAPMATGLQLLQNRPNPFTGTTAISFVLPQESEAQLRIFDVSGRMLAERKGQYPAGKNEETFDLEGAAGVLWYELATPFGVLAKKMVAY